MQIFDQQIVVLETTVSIEDQSEVAYGLSTGTSSDDLEWPWTCAMYLFSGTDEHGKSAKAMLLQLNATV